MLQIKKNAEIHSVKCERHSTMHIFRQFPCRVDPYLVFKDFSCVYDMPLLFDNSPFSQLTHPALYIYGAEYT